MNQGPAYAWINTSRQSKRTTFIDTAHLDYAFDAQLHAITYIIFVLCYVVFDYSPSGV